MRAGTSPLSYIAVIDHHILLSLIGYIFEGEQDGFFTVSKQDGGENFGMLGSHRLKACILGVLKSEKIWIFFLSLSHNFEKVFMQYHLSHTSIISYNLFWFRELLPKFTTVVYVIIGASSQNHMHMSSSENYNMLSNATGCRNDSKHLHRGFFNPLIANLRALWPLQEYNSRPLLWLSLEYCLSLLIVCVGSPF